MTATEIIAEGLGFLAIGLGFFIFQQKKRDAILLFKLSSDTLWILHFMMLGATSGMILSIAGIMRSIVFLVLYLRGKECPSTMPTIRPIRWSAATARC